MAPQFPRHPQTMAGGERSDTWDLLVPRLIHPTRIVIIEAAARIGRPLSVTELTTILGDAGLDRSNIWYHVQRLEEVGVLKLVSGTRGHGRHSERFALRAKAELLSELEKERRQ